MRYLAYHGSPRGAFRAFDRARSGSGSGYDHAKNVVSFTSSVSVASHYAEEDGFIGRFAFDLENAYELDDADRPMGIPRLIKHARNLGHDGVVLRNCVHAAVSPGVPSDIFFVFNFSAPQLVEVTQAGRGDEAEVIGHGQSPSARHSQRAKPREGGRRLTR